VPADQRLKGRLGIPGGVFPHQGHVIRIGHLPVYYRTRRNRTFFFRDPFAARFTTSISTGSRRVGHIGNN
jgi:hypothetical protein